MNNKEYLEKCLLSFRTFVSNNHENINSDKLTRDRIVKLALKDIANGLVGDKELSGLLSGYYAQFMIKPFIGMRCGLFMDAKEFISIMSKNLKDKSEKPADDLHDLLTKFGNAVLDSNNPRWIEP